MLTDCKIQVKDFKALFIGDVVQSILNNIRNDWVRLVIKAEPNSMRHDSHEWNTLYDPNCEKIVCLSRAFSREILLANYYDVLRNEVYHCFNQFQEHAFLLYVAVEWRQYTVQHDGEITYETFEEVLYNQLKNSKTQGESK